MTKYREERVRNWASRKHDIKKISRKILLDRIRQTKIDYDEYVRIREKSFLRWKAEKTIFHRWDYEFWKEAVKKASNKLTRLNIELSRRENEGK